MTAYVFQISPYKVLISGSVLMASGIRLSTLLETSLSGKKRKKEKKTINQVALSRMTVQLQTFSPPQLNSQVL